MEPTTLALYGLGTAASLAAAAKIKTRLELSRAKHASLTGHVRMSRRIASIVPYYELAPDRAFACDGAPDDVASLRRAGFEALAADYRARFSRTIALKAEAKPVISDMQFTDAYRVPFPFSRMVSENLGASPFVQSSGGVMLEDVDGNSYFDASGSYGVNVLGYDAYKDMLAKGAARVDALGPVLGLYHPVVASNVQRLRQISGFDEVSFHMSGTEAVMQAVRLARYHTGRNRIVRFAGAYHGWWGDVQPGIGNPIRARDTFTLAEMSEAALRVLARRRDIACVLVNPIQAMHPNAGPPGDSALVDSSRTAAFDRDAYAAWLAELRRVCSERGIVFILDDVFMGFRLAPGGSQEYFGVRADMVTYGKSLGGGLPVGVLCGRSNLMKRFREGRPGDICFARGTFNSHPYVMGAMAEFLDALERPETLALYRDLDAIWSARASALNRRLSERGLPVAVANMSTVWCVLYTRPSRFNWMFQYYLRRHGIALSWVGTGRLIFSLNYTQADYDGFADRFVAAAEAMGADGWWWHDEAAQAETRPSIKRQVLREMFELGVVARWKNRSGPAT
jgi:glutamate-1-semialdehyde 2,1-aminomutase